MARVRVPAPAATPTNAAPLPRLFAAEEAPRAALEVGHRHGKQMAG